MNIGFPIIFEWNGEVMRPLRKFAKICDREFSIGMQYRLATHEDRSSNSHSHFFAALHDAWANLPEEQSERFLTETHLRKFALIKCGFADSRQFVSTSKDEAIRLAAFIRTCDEYSLVTVDGQVVTVYTAQSQSMQNMGKSKFQDSKTKVLDYLSNIIGVTTHQLIEEAGKSA